MLQAAEQVLFHAEANVPLSVLCEPEYLKKGPTLARNHYTYEKRLRETTKKHKREEKQERKDAKKNPQGDENPESPVVTEQQ